MLEEASSVHDDRSAVKNRIRVTAVVLGLAVSAWSCGGSSQAPSPLEGGVLATFSVSGETFRVWITNPETIAQVLALRAGTSSANIPNGRILRGAGQGNHNAPYGWHLDPQDIALAEIAIEVCDGRPSYVQRNIDEFVDNVRRYCPWAATLVALDDRR
jgi:hypothetical protein